MVSKESAVSIALVVTAVIVILIRPSVFSLKPSLASILSSSCPRIREELKRLPSTLITKGGRKEDDWGESMDLFVERAQEHHQLELAQLWVGIRRKPHRNEQ